MIIGIDASRAIEGERTGTEAYSLFLTRSLIPLATSRGHRIRLYYNDRPAEEIFPTADDIEHVELSFPRLWTHLRLASELHRRPPDVFFTPAHVLPYSYRRPSVATVHDLGFLVYPEAHTRRQLVYLRWSTGHNSRRARKVIVDSEATKKDLIKYYKIPAEKVEVIFPGIDPELRPVMDADKRAAVMEKYGITPPYILHIGTIQPRKNLTRLIDSFIGSGVDHQLVLAGKLGWLAEPIVAKVQEMKPANRERILLAGYIAAEDKGALISAAEALVFPSLYEGFGFPVVEANACATPVLASNSSSIPEVAGDAALLVDPLNQTAIGNGISHILDDETLRHRLVKAGFNNVRRFSWETAAVKTLDVLENAAS
ncbi:MAG: glycosyltransferase family 1 protein [Candidatus Promineifilaceae bacterium]